MSETLVYDAICRWDGNRFSLTLPQFGIEKNGNNLADLHAELTEALQKLRSIVQDIGAEDVLFLEIHQACGPPSAPSS